MTSLGVEKFADRFGHLCAVYDPLLEGGQVKLAGDALHRLRSMSRLHAVDAHEAPHQLWATLRPILAERASLQAAGQADPYTLRLVRAL
jgi:hypothetical protein